MRAIVHEWHTQVFPDSDEVKELCKPGAGADTCILLLMSGDGFECHAHNRMPIMSLIARARRGETNAQREGCDRVLNWNMGSKLGEVSVP